MLPAPPAPGRESLSLLNGVSAKAGQESFGMGRPPGRAAVTRGLRLDGFGWPPEIPESVAVLDVNVVPMDSERILRNHTVLVSTD